MTPVLARKLIEAGAIRAGSTIEVLGSIGNGRRLPDSFVMAGAKVLPSGQSVIFELSDRRGGRVRIPSTQVASVDGMSPIRLAAIYNFSLAGDAIPVGKRRGRKPKNRNPVPDANMADADPLDADLTDDDMQQAA